MLLLLISYKCDNDTSTFYSEARYSVSWRDHIVVSSNLFDAVDNVTIDQGFVTSDHIPISITFVLNCASVICNEYFNNKCKLPWDKLSKSDICKYKQTTDCNLQSVILDHSLLLCDNVNCKDPSYLIAIDRLYANITA